MGVAAHGLRCGGWPEADEEEGQLHKAEGFWLLTLHLKCYSNILSQVVDGGVTGILLE